MFTLLIGLGAASLVACIAIGLRVEKRQRAFPDELE